MFTKNVKKIIIFFVPFLFIFNVKCSDNIVRYYYEGDGADYIVTIRVNAEEIEDVKILKKDSDASGGEVPIYVGSFGNFYTNDLGIFAFENTLEELEMADVNDRDIQKLREDFIKNLKNYKPILVFDNNDNPYLISPYFNKWVWEETSDNSHSTNLNDYSMEFVLNLLNGDLTPVKTSNINKSFNEIMKINTNKTPTFTRLVNDATDSKDTDDNDNISYTGGTCDGYDKRLKSLNEKIVGTENKKGVCSAKSLNAIQNYSSLYDIKKMFDKSVLEEVCREAIFGSNGYIDTIEDAMTYYTALKNENEKNKLACLSMQSQYLAGLTLLTSYTSIADEADKKGCELIPENVTKFINDLFDALKTISISLCIFLCISDAYKIVVTKEKDITKFKTVLVKRVIALVALFLTPLFVDIVVDLVNDRYLKNNPDKCSNIIKE